MSSTAAYRRERYARHARLGLCKHCTAPRTQGVFCDRHAKANREERRRAAARRIAAGLCVRCMKPLVNAQHSRRRSAQQPSP